MPEPEGLLFLAFVAVIFGAALVVGGRLVFLGVRKKKKASVFSGALILGISLLPGWFVIGWVHYWMTAP